MPRYYLHQRLGSELIPDLEGSELDDLEAAREEAIISAREIMSAAIHEGRDISARAFEVTDEAGETVLVLPFLVAISVSR